MRKKSVLCVGELLWDLLPTGPALGGAPFNVAYRVNQTGGRGRIATRLGIFGQVLHALVPRVAQIIMNSAFRMFPDSAVAQGRREGEAPAGTAEQMALANLMRGIHF